MLASASRPLVLVLIFALLALGPAAPPASAQPALDVVRIAVIPTETAAVAYYANDLGYFQAAGIKPDFSTLQNGSAIAAGVISGSADVGFSNLMSLVVAHDKGFPVRILLGNELYRSSDPTDGILEVAKTSPIHVAKDLDGKTVAVISLSNLSYFALRNWIDRNGGDSTTVHFVETTIPLLVGGLLSGRTDAASMDPGSAATDRAKAGLRHLADTFDSISPRFIASGWFTTESWAQQHPDVARRFTEALRKASAWANAHPRDSVKLYEKYSAFTEAELLATRRPFFDPVTDVDLVQPVIDVAARYGAIKAVFPAKDLMVAN